MKQGNVYKVSVTIGQVGGYHPGEDNPDYTCEMIVWSISENNAIAKVELHLECDLKRQYGPRFLETGYAISRKCELILEDVWR